MINTAKKTCLIVLLGLMDGFFFIASAQEHGWNKTYLGDRPVMLFSSVVKDTMGYLITGCTYGQQINRSKAMLGRINNTGQIDQLRWFVDSNSTEYQLIFNTLTFTNRKQYAFTGYAFDSLAYLIFGTVGRGLDSLRLYQFTSANTYAFFGKALVELDDFYYIAGVRTNNSPLEPNVVLVKIDTLGNLVWQKEYGLSNWQEDATSLITLSNGHLLIGAERLDVYHTPQRANTWLIEVDTAGSIIRQWLDNTDSTYAAYGLKQTADGGFVYGCQKKVEESVNSVYYNNQIVKRNFNFTKQWLHADTNLTLDGHINDIELLADGSMIACGQIEQSAVDPTVMYGWVIKLSPAGSVIWERHYSGVNASATVNYLRDIDILPDGSMIAVGECDPRSGSSPQLGWFLRLDANGCELENCTWGTPNAVADITDNQQIHIYPNPANTTINILLPADMLGATVQIHNVVGQTVWLQKTHEEYTQPDISSFQKGIYIVSAVKGNRHLQAKLVVD